MSFKITYSTMGASMDLIHSEFEKALLEAKSLTGKTYQTGRGSVLENFNPSDTRQKLNEFFTQSISDLDQVYELAEKSQKSWANFNWQERVRIIKAAAERVSDNKFLYSAMTTLEVGKNRLESLGEVEEAADLLRYYAQQVEESSGYVKPMLRLNPNEETLGVLRPYGVFSVIAPFNFPVALAAGMVGAALLGGNSVVLKPSAHTPWSGEIIREVFLAAGLPQGVLQVIYGDVELGRAMVKHAKSHGICFTGSHAVGMEILKTPWRSYSRPILMELGGKNPTIITESADLNIAVEGAYRSAFGLSGQKCSALSRIYVHEAVKDQFINKFVQKTATLKIGQAHRAETFIGPVNNKAAVMRYKKMLGLAQSEGQMHYYDETLAQQEELMHGNFVSPIVVEVPHKHLLMTEEHFLPLVCVNTFKNFDEALTKANDTQYGLTAGLFTQNKSEIDRFLNEAEAGVLYVNRASGATTGAWPGVQPFCGWKGSGATGKGGCGPYYVSQFMREQSRTCVTPTCES